MITNILKRWFHKPRRDAASCKRKLFVDGGGHDGCSVRKWLHSHPDFETVSFEPNTKLAPCFSDIKGPLIQAALWTEDGEVTFFIDEKDFDGSSVFADQSGLVGGTKISVPAVKLSRWLMENVSPDDYCVLKLDIEGAEYPVLEQLLEEGSISRVDELFVEFHIRFLKERISKDRHNTLVRRLEERGLFPRDWNALDKRFKPPVRPAGQTAAY